MRNHERRELFVEALLLGVIILAYEAFVRGSVNWVFVIGSPLLYAVVKPAIGRINHGVF
ncbi:hypothetical protein [Halostagnicola bangensis]